MALGVGGLVVVAVLTAACTGGDRADNTTTTGPTAATGVGSEQPVDLREVDWENAAVPAAICGGKGTVQLEGGVALVSSTRWTDDWQGAATTEVHGQVEMWSYGDTQYGDIDGDGSDDAVVPLWCTNGGGTAGGQLGQGLALLSGGTGEIVVLGTVTPTEPGAGVHAPYYDSSSVQIADHRLTVEENRYSADDPACCPSGRTTTTWTYANGELRRE